MIRRRILGIATAAASTLVALAALRASETPAPAAAPGGKPKLVIENEVVDAGQIVRGSDAKFTFVVKNAGDALLQITSAKPG